MFHFLAQQPWLSCQNISPTLAHLLFACLLHKGKDDVRLVKGLNGGCGHCLNSRATCLMSVLWKCEWNNFKTEMKNRGTPMEKLRHTVEIAVLEVVCGRSGNRGF